MNTTNAAQSNRHKGAVFTGLAVVAFVCAGTSFFYFNHSDDMKNFIVFSELPKNTAIESSLKTVSGTETLEAQENIIPFTAALKEKTTAPYRLNSTLKLQNGGYRDFTLTLNKDGKSLTVLADGFHAYDLMTLKIDGRPVYNRAPMDWSGRLELISPLPVNKNVEACIDIMGQTESVGLCHSIMQRRAG